MDSLNFTLQDFTRTAMSECCNMAVNGIVVANYRSYKKYNVQAMQHVDYYDIIWDKLGLKKVFFKRVSVGEFNGPDCGGCRLYNFKGLKGGLDFNEVVDLLSSEFGIKIKMDQ